jgi:hypothetical protein
VPFTPTPDLQTWGWPQEPDRAARLALFATSYGDLVEPAELVDLAIVRLVSMAARMEREIRAGNPAFQTHKKRNTPGDTAEQQSSSFRLATRCSEHFNSS